MAPVRAVWGYPHSMSKAQAKCNNGTITCISNNPSGSGRNKGSEISTGREETLYSSAALIDATADGDGGGSETIRPIQLNDFRKYASIHAV